ncbi:MAG TPA: ABC transporter permease [Methanocorpusculum sp.]|nr:ABC transporter permease [Methanocorpusculum sp.]
MSSLVFSLAVRNLKLNKFRTALSMIGIIIGVFTICALGMVGAGLQENINDTIASTANSLQISSIEEKYVDGNKVTGLSDKDVKEIESAVASVSTEYTIATANMGNKRVTANGDSAYAIVIGMDEEGMMASLNGHLEEGSIPTSNGGVVILKEYADKHGLHVNSRISTTNIKGEKITLRVTGIMESTQMTKLMANSRDLCMLFGSHELYRNLLGNNYGLYSYCMVVVNDPYILTPMENAVERKMNGKSFKDGDDRVTISNSYDNVESLNEILDMIGVFRTALSSISLIVAAVAIVNVMLMSVKERTREIGILRSIGTKKRQILQMFIYEAGMIGFIGALIGVILSVISVPIVLNLMGCLEVMGTISVLVYIPMGIFIGILVCVFAGLYPAFHAANLNPVEAMATD